MTHTHVIEWEHTAPVATENIKQNISSFTFSILNFLTLFYSYQSYCHDSFDQSIPIRSEEQKPLLSVNF